MRTQSALQNSLPGGSEAPRTLNERSSQGQIKPFLTRKRRQALTHKGPQDLMTAWGGLMADGTPTKKGAALPGAPFQQQVFNVCRRLGLAESLDAA